MAELLILNFDTISPDPERNRLGYKRGHVIDIKPNGHVWGSQEQLPKFVQLDISDATVQEVYHFLNPWELKLSFTVVGSAEAL